MDADKKDKSQIEIDGDLADRIEAVARARGMSVDEVLRMALDRFQAGHAAASECVPQDESLFERLHKARLIGCLSGGPNDLSTNPAYFEGFGN